MTIGRTRVHTGYMLDYIAAGILFLFGIQSGSVRGDSTTSAIPVTSAAKTREELGALEQTFLEKHRKAGSNWVNARKNFVESISKLSDPKKQAALETIQDRLTGINSAQTNLLMLKLSYLSAALNRIEEEAAAHNKETGRGIVNITNAITAARSSVGTAITLVTAQVGKTYVIKDVTNQTTLRENTLAERNKLATDLKPIREAVGEARKKTADALKALRQATGKTTTMSVKPEPVDQGGSVASPTAVPTGAR